MQYRNKLRSQSLFRHPHRPIIEFAQTVTDVSNWERARRLADLVSAGLTTVIGTRVWLGQGLVAVNRILRATTSVSRLKPVALSDNRAEATASAMQPPSPSSSVPADGSRSGSGSGVISKAIASRIRDVIALGQGTRSPAPGLRSGPVLAALTALMATRWARQSSSEDRLVGLVTPPDSQPEEAYGQLMEFQHSPWHSPEEWNDWSDGWSDLSFVPIRSLQQPFSGALQRQQTFHSRPYTNPISEAVPLTRRRQLHPLVAERAGGARILPAPSFSSPKSRATNHMGRAMAIPNIIAPPRGSCLLPIVRLSQQRQAMCSSPMGGPWGRL